MIRSVVAYQGITYVLLSSGKARPREVDVADLAIINAQIWTLDR